jgi:hypothetical protein
MKNYEEKIKEIVEKYEDEDSENFFMELNGLTSAQAAFAIIAAKRRLQREKTISVQQIEIDDYIELDFDVLPTVGGIEAYGAWVRVWLRVSAAQINDAQKGSSKRERRRPR